MQPYHSGSPLMMFEVKTSSDGIVVKIYVQPKSSRNQVSGIYRGALKLKITSPPVDGAANKMCIRFFAKQLGVAKSRLEIVSGRTGRMKRLLVKADAAEIPVIQQKIDSLLSG